MPETPPSQLADQSHAPLLGKTILVTRTKEQAAEFIKLLEQLGASVILYPTIRIVPPHSWEECDRAIANIKNYDAIVLTSMNAAENFFERVRFLNNGTTKLIAEKTVYAVGEKTRSTVEKYNIPVAAMPAVYDAKHLAITLARTDVKGKRFLFPKGNLAGNVVTFDLQEHGAVVDEVIVYETIEPSHTDAESVRQKLQHLKLSGDHTRRIAGQHDDRRYRTYDGCGRKERVAPRSHRRRACDDGKSCCLNSAIL
jgi:uroporphyrinogen III methyltransferase/synthase